MIVTSVPMLDLRREGPDVDVAMEAAFARVLRSGHYILGPEVEAFERECASALGVAHAIGVSSGTDALLLALMTLGIGKGDEVICPTYTFFATAGTVWRVGARPVFVDVLPGSMNIDPEDVERKITARTRAVLPVHLFGQCAEMDPLLGLARARGLTVIEDAAQAIGARYRGRGAGTMGELGCFSFFPSKNLGTLGDAGMLVTEDSALAERARILRVHGGKPKYHHAWVGGNFRIDALHAALLRVKLPGLDARTARRQGHASRYAAQLAPAGERLLLPSVEQERHVFNQYVVRVPGAGQRDRLRAHLAAHHVGTEIYYPVPMHLQGCFASLGHASGEFPVAERAALESLALPIFAELTDDEVDYVARAVMAFLR